MGSDIIDISWSDLKILGRSPVYKQAWHILWPSFLCQYIVIYNIIAGISLRSFSRQDPSLSVGTRYQIIFLEKFVYTLDK